MKKFERIDADDNFGATQEAFSVGSNESVMAINSIAVVIVNFRTAALAIESARAVAATTQGFASLQIIIVDGDSGDGSNQAIADAIARGDCPGELLALPVNGGFAFANNQAILKLRDRGTLPDAIALINPDARVRPGAIAAMAALLTREPRAGAVGALLETESGEAQGSAFHDFSAIGEFCRGASIGPISRVLGRAETVISPARAAEVPWVCGAAVLLRIDALRASGLFDDGFFLYFEETELLHRMRKHGWTVWHEPAAAVVHIGGVATQLRDPKTGQMYFSRPAYWYRSRQRYFALVGGRGKAIAANLAFLAGRLIAHLVSPLVPAKQLGTSRGGRDILRLGLWPSRAEAQAAIVRLDQPAAECPAWMKESA